MKDIGLEGAGITSTAISEPFTLFHRRGNRQMRAGIFSRPVLEKYQVGSDLATNMIRGYCPESPHLFTMPGTALRFREHSLSNSWIRANPCYGCRHWTCQYLSSG